MEQVFHAVNNVRVKQPTTTPTQHLLRTLFLYSERVIGEFLKVFRFCTVTARCTMAQQTDCTVHYTAVQV